VPPDIVRDLGLLALGTRMRRLGELLYAHTQGIMQEFDLSIPASQHPFLAALDREGSLTVGELAEAVGITQPGATRTIGQLVEAGLVEMAVCDGDQRRRTISLSPAGREFVSFCKSNVWPAVDAAVRDLCADLDGPLLDQLAAIEDGLARKPLVERINDNGKQP